jgi:3-deoxy-D-manno-octulosonic-acid transferase
MQTEQDALKVISLGANADNVKIAGSTKFDIEVDFKEEELAHLSEKLSITEQDKVVIAGSTHHPEEKIMLNCYRKLVEDFENLKLILVPRHIERTEQIIREAKNQGFQAFKFSQLGKKDKNVNSQPRLIVVDVMGKLKLMYSLATVVFIGGSLAKIGGHNMIEPAFFAKPIIFGPYVFNFQSLAEQLLKAHASYMVKDQDELLDRMRYLLKNRQMRLKLGQNAKKITQKSKGATNKNIGFIESFIAS